MKDFFYGIEDLFVGFLFKPFDALRLLELDNWWMSNIVSWLLTIIGIVAIVYWLNELRKFDKDEDKSVTAHSYL